MDELIKEELALRRALADEWVYRSHLHIACQGHWNDFLAANAILDLMARGLREGRVS